MADEQQRLESALIALLGLQQLRGAADPEAAHSDADDILCDLLVDLGFSEVVEAFHAVPKWYA